MKKKLISTLLCVSMVATMAAGCGSSTETATDSNAGDSNEAAATEAAPAESETAGEEGSVLNIYCWNE